MMNSIKSFDVEKVFETNTNDKLNNLMNSFKSKVPVERQTTDMTLEYPRSFKVTNKNSMTSINSRG